MAMTTFVCLAKSGKYQGLCIAGKTEKGEWFRPVGKDGGLSYDQCKYCNFNEIALLDVVTCNFKSHVPERHQTENFKINGDMPHCFSLQRKLNYSDLNEICDNPETIFGVGSSSGKGKNDLFVPGSVNNSLLLVYVTNAKLYCYLDTYDEKPKKRHRMEFEYNGNIYNLAVTDSYTYHRMNAGDEEEHDECYITVSIGLDYPSKFVSGIFIKNE